jgi:hypothetical protein
MEDGKFTMFAGKSVALAEVFKFTVGKEPFSGPTVCRLELSAPNEESTDGGRLAVQHVSIVPDGGGPTTVIATAYQVDKRAELRQYEVVAETYKKRFHSSNFPVSPGQFDDMTRKLKDFFQQFGFKVELQPLAAALPTAAPARAAPGAPAPGAAPVAKRSTAPQGMTPRSAAGAAGGEGGASSRPWLIIGVLAVAVAAVAAVAVYLLQP